MHITGNHSPCPTGDRPNQREQHPLYILCALGGETHWSCLHNVCLWFMCLALKIPALDCAGERGEMGVSLGHVSYHERRADPLVLHRQLCSRGVLSIRYDSFHVIWKFFNLYWINKVFLCRNPEYDHHQNFEKRHCQLQQRRWYCKMQLVDLFDILISPLWCYLSAFSLFL